jgi:hypothetical protein
MHACTGGEQYHKTLIALSQTTYLKEGSAGIPDCSKIKTRRTELIRVMSRQSFH